MNENTLDNRLRSINMYNIRDFNTRGDNVKVIIDNTGFILYKDRLLTVEIG